MPQSPYLHPTVTQRLRAFLRSQATPLPPWSTSEDVVDRLREVLHERREDPSTTTELVSLIEDLQRNTVRTDRLATQDAELLSQRKISEIVQELRAASSVPGTSRKSNGGVKQFIAERTAAAVACLTLIGFAFQAGCGSDDGETTAQGGSGGSAGGSAGQGGAVDGGTGGQADAAKDALSEVFQDGSPEDIAAQLEAMAQDAKNEGAAGSAPAYKGIIFDHIEVS